MAGRRNHYREANLGDSELHPIDDEVDRRVRHRGLRKRIIDQRQLYLQLEQLVGVRSIDREEASFNIGFDYGLVRGRADALAEVLHNQGKRGRALAAGLAQLAMNAGLEPPRAVAALLEVAWAMTLGPRKALARTPRATPGG